MSYTLAVTGMMILLMFYIINQDICLMNTKIDLFYFKIYFQPLILWTQYQIEISGDF